MARALSWTLAGVVLLATGCASIEERRFINSVKNKPARDFQLDDLTGAPVKLSSFRGKPVVVAFFAYG